MAKTILKATVPSLEHAAGCYSKLTASRVHQQQRESSSITASMVSRLTNLGLAEASHPARCPVMVRTNLEGEDPPLPELFC